MKNIFFLFLTVLLTLSSCTKEDGFLGKSYGDWGQSDLGYAREFEFGGNCQWAHFNVTEVGVFLEATFQDPDGEWEVTIFDFQENRRSQPGVITFGPGAAEGPDAELENGEEIIVRHECRD